MMKTFLVLLFSTVIMACSSPSTKQPESPTVPAVKAEAVVIEAQPEADSLKGSLDAMATGKIGQAAFTIRYHSPAVRGRIVWGGLVPFDRVWVTGAHMATSVEFDRDISIDGQRVPAGKYAFFTIPGKEKWTVILNSDWQQHLTDEYDEKLDVVRVKIKPERESTHQERLRYVIEADDDTKGEWVVYWEKLEISLPVTILQ
ncbi:MAG: DUF2911 domain-containing protein [Cyclobacteriaceae bacterium]|nr:DUF2911 domain-containing protein [Cyclobacteriaceae bacterium]